MPTYSIFIHVPIYTDGPRCYVISEWARALTLLRDSFDGQFDRFILTAPSRDAVGSDVILEPIGEGDGFDPRPSLSADVGKRGYWLGGARQRWKQDVAAVLDETDFAHTVIGDLYRPISLDALRMVQSRALPFSLFLDTDTVVQIRNLIAAGLMRNGPDRKGYVWYYEWLMRRVVGCADVTFLKGQALYDRYGSFARNPRLFHDTSYRSEEVIGADVIEERISRRGDGPLRLVYCGRMVARKGCDQSLSILARARSEGADVTLDLIGNGEEREALEAQARTLGLGEAVRFLGERPYGPDLLRQLAEYDGLLFTPVSEDTPRMIFDGYAAGLPLVGYDIPYVQERAAEEQATVLLPSGQIERAADIVKKLTAAPDQIAELARAALRAGQNNATDVWYRRRAEWTLEAYVEAVSAGAENTA